MPRRYFVGKRTGNGEYSGSGGGEHVGSGLADAQFIILFTAAVLGQLSPPADGGRDIRAAVCLRRVIISTKRQKNFKIFCEKDKKMLAKP